MLTHLRDLPERANDGHVVGMWSCICGSHVAAINSRVRNGYIRSCGCDTAEARSAPQRKHGCAILQNIDRGRP